MKFFRNTKYLCTLIIMLCTLGLIYILVHDFSLLFEKTRKSVLTDCQNEFLTATSKFNTLMHRSSNIISDVAGPLEKMIKEKQPRENILKFLRERDNFFKKTEDLNFVSIYGVVYDRYIDSGPWVPDSTYQPKSRLWYTEAIKGKGKIVISPPYQDADTGQIVISMSVMLSDGKSVLGIDNYYSDVIQQIKRQNHNSVGRFLLDRYGNLIVNSGDKRESTDSEYSKLFNELRFHLSRQNFVHDSVTTESINGDEYTVLTRKLLDNWTSITVISHKHVFFSVCNTLLSHFIITAVIALLICLLIIAGFRSISREHAKAVAADKSKSLFFAMVSHEIRTPLNSIIGFSRILRDSDMDKTTTSEYLNYIVSSGQTLASIINDILDLSKLDAGKLQIVNEYCNFPQIVNGVNGIFFLKAEQSDNKIIVDIDDNFPLLKLDHGRIKQILFNIIGNAVKFTANGTITVKASFKTENAKYGKLQFSVTDTGVGIAKNILQNILDPFVSSIRQTRNHGTGLGLPICAKLLTQMNGNLDIKSEIDKGSTFTVTLNNVKYKSKSPDDIKQTMNTPIPLSSKPLKLLLCDDVELNLKVLSIMLNKQYSAQCVCAHSAEEVLERLEIENFDAILTDMWMPEMNGEDLLKLIRTKPEFNNLPVYVISADVLMIDTWEKIGFSGIITKPINSESLQAFVSDMTKKTEHFKSSEN